MQRPIDWTDKTFLLMKQYLFVLTALFCAPGLVHAQVPNANEEDFPTPGTSGLHESDWGTYLLQGFGNDRALRLGVSNDTWLWSEIELENNNNLWGKIHFKTANSAGNLENRMTILGNGNVGIGTTAPAAQLSVWGQNVEFYSQGTENTLTLGRDENQVLKMRVTDNLGFLDLVQDADENGPHVFYIRNESGGSNSVNDIRFQTDSEDRLSIRKNGNIGIGTINPQAKLEVIGDAYFSNVRVVEEVTTAETQWIFAKSGLDRQIGFALTNDKYKKAEIKLWEGNSHNPYISFSTAPSADVHAEEHLRITKSGNVGIGTTDPKNKLSVQGTVWANEIKVSMTDGADWVFDPSYKLRSLAEVEAYIDENRHLPDVPSADDFRKHDLNVAEMDNTLLQKVEELTLYMIEMNKKVERLQQENEELKSAIDGCIASDK